MAGDELMLVGSALGVNMYYAQKSTKKADKKMPKEFYRNRFIAGDTADNVPILKKLKSDGIFDCGEPQSCFGGSRQWWVTDIGIEVFKAQFDEFVNTSSKYI